MLSTATSSVNVNLCYIAAIVRNEKTIYLANNQISNPPAVDNYDDLTKEEKTNILSGSAWTNGEIPEITVDEDNYLVLIWKNTYELSVSEITNNKIVLSSSIPSEIQTLSLSTEEITQTKFSCYLPCFPTAAPLKEGNVNLFSDNNIAFGENAKSYGEASVAIGKNCIADNSYSLAIGKNNYSAYGSVVTGKENECRGLYSTVVGLSNKVTGSSSLCTGQNNKVLADYSINCGYQNSATGKYSAVFGYANTSSGTYAVTFGNGCSATGTESFAGGSESTATGARSFSWGRKNTAKGISSAVLGGINNTAEENTQGSFVTGWSNKAAQGHQCCAVFGYGNTTTNSYQTIVGVAATPSAEDVFVVGNNDLNNRKTLLTVNSKNGLTLNSGNLTISSGNLTLNSGTLYVTGAVDVYGRIETNYGIAITKADSNPFSITSNIDINNQSTFATVAKISPLGVMYGRELRLYSSAFDDNTVATLSYTIANEMFTPHYVYLVKDTDIKIVYYGSNTVINLLSSVNWINHAKSYNITVDDNGYVCYLSSMGTKIYLEEYSFSANIPLQLYSVLTDGARLYL